MEQEQLQAQLEEMLDMAPTAGELFTFLDGLFSYLDTEYGTIYIDTEDHEAYTALAQALAHRLCAEDDPELEQLQLCLLNTIRSVLYPEYRAGAHIDQQLQRMMDLLTLHQMYESRDMFAFEAAMKKYFQAALDTIDQKYQDAYEKKRKFDAGSVRTYLQRAEAAESALELARTNGAQTKAMLLTLQSENQRLKLELAQLKKQISN